MRKAMKFLHSMGAAGMIGALAAYFILLALAPQDSAQAYADLRTSIAAICNYLLVPSMAATLVSGLMGMAVHHPFHALKWVWIKAASGIAVFEGTLTLVGSKADYAATIAQRILEGETTQEALDKALASEWQHAGFILLLCVFNVLIGVWRPSFARKVKRQDKPSPAE